MKYKNKRGVSGAFMALWIFTIAIVVLLLIFALGSSVIRQIDKSKSGLKVYESEEIGLGKLIKYMSEEFPMVLEKRAKQTEVKNE
jgi:hypothetical protein